MQHWFVLDCGIDLVHELRPGSICIVDPERQLHAVRGRILLVRLWIFRVHCGERGLLCALGRPDYAEPVFVGHVSVVERASGVPSVPTRHCLVAARLALVPGVLVWLLWQCDRSRRVLQLPGRLDRHAAIAHDGRHSVHVMRRRFVHQCPRAGRVFEVHAGVDRGRNGRHRMFGVRSGLVCECDGRLGVPVVPGRLVRVAARLIYLHFVPAGLLLERDWYCHMHVVRGRLCAAKYGRYSLLGVRGGLQHAFDGPAAAAVQSVRDRHVFELGGRRVVRHVPDGHVCRSWRVDVLAVRQWHGERCAGSGGVSDLRGRLVCGNVGRPGRWADRLHAVCGWLLAISERSGIVRPVRIWQVLGVGAGAAVSGVPDRIQLGVGDGDRVHVVLSGHDRVDHGSGFMLQLLVGPVHGRHRSGHVPDVPGRQVFEPVGRRFMHGLPRRHLSEPVGTDDVQPVSGRNVY